ncbi:MAG: hypothetical protein QW756_08305 [Nitrososphaerota archaeon]
MNAKTFPLVFMAWLIASIPSLAWYDLRAYEALLHISHDRAGKDSSSAVQSFVGDLGSSLASFSQ